MWRRFIFPHLNMLLLDHDILSWQPHSIKNMTIFSDNFLNFLDLIIKKQASSKTTWNIPVGIFDAIHAGQWASDVQWTGHGNILQSVCLCNSVLQYFIAFPFLCLNLFSFSKSITKIQNYSWLSLINIIRVCFLVPLPCV